MTLAAPTHARIIFQDDSFADVDSDGLILDALDQASGDIIIQFGSTLGEFIQWNATDLRFEISDGLDFNSHEIFEVRLENTATLPGGLGAGDTGRIVGLTAVDSVAPGCLGPHCPAGAYVWGGSEWDQLSNQVTYVEPGMDIQDAIDNLPGGGGKVRLLEGTHSVTDAIDVTASNVILEGEGPATIVTTSSGTWTDTETVDDAVIQVGSSDGTTPVSNVLIRNFTVQVDPDVHGIQVNGGSDIDVRDMIIESIGPKTSRRTGLVFTDGSAAIGTRFHATGNLITREAAADRWFDSLHVDGNADFVGSLFGYGNGITDSTFSENTFFESNSIGAVLTEVSSSTFSDNKFRDASFLGFINVVLNDIQDVAIVNNTFEGDQSGSTAINMLDNVDNSIFAGNAFRGGPSPFITGITSTAATNEDNIITNNQFESVTTHIADAGTNTKIETHHHRGTVAPTTTDDITLGYSTGTIWIDTVTNITYILVDDTATAAIWAELTYTEAAATPPIACSASFAGKTFMDTDTGIVYVCDTSNGRNKWLSQDEKIIFGEDTGTCNAGNDPNNDEGCNVDWGNNLGPEGGTNLGFYIRHPITVTGVGFSQDNDACTSGSFDLEVWSTGSNVDDNTYALEATISSALTAETHNAGGLNIDVAGDQYIIWGIDNNCGQSIDDWNMVLYFRHRHD